MLRRLESYAAERSASGEPAVGRLVIPVNSDQCGELVPFTLNQAAGNRESGYERALDWRLPSCRSIPVRATPEAMIVLDKSRALDLMISRSEQVQVPEPFSSGLWDVPVDSGALCVAVDPTDSYPLLTNLLGALRQPPRVAAPQPDASFMPRVALTAVASGDGSGDEWKSRRFA